MKTLDEDIIYDTLAIAREVDDINYKIRFAKIRLKNTHEGIQELQDLNTEKNQILDVVWRRLLFIANVAKNSEKWEDCFE